MKRNILITIIAVLVILGSLVFGYIHKVRTINIPTKNQHHGEDIAKGEVVPYLKVPEGFKITFFAKDLPGARAIEFDPQGRMLVSQTKEGKISIIEDKEGDGISDTTRTLVSGLKNPHGMAWRCPYGLIDSEPCYLFVAESNQLTRYEYSLNSNQEVVLSGKTKLADISYSATDNHFTRSLLFLPAPNQDTLLISVGSSCNVCNEKDRGQANGHAKILSYNVKTAKLEEYAKGLRNSVFMTLNPVSGKVFATEMGRDALGDDIPPDEINIIEKGKDYGWPNCYGQNIHDTNFDKNTYIRNPCMEPFETPSLIDLQAHSAPLGLSFVPEEGWAEDYWYNLLVSYHGSWNRSVPTGYKIERLKMNAKGEYTGSEDFITGFLDSGDKKNGRPVDIKIFPGGIAYISDDLAGVIYKLSRE